MTLNHSGTVKVFAGIPEKWKKVSFKNIRLPGPFLISASKENRQVKIKSIGGNRIRLNIHGGGNGQLNQNEKSEYIQFPAVINFSEGEKVTVLF